ncbi:MAG: TetR/AcrR family transcriptional regulator [Pseudomonadota bacterium]
MPRSRTPDRILGAALAMFNEFGEPNVTTNRIADELDISPGNLHYHFRTKQDLIDTLFGQYERRMLTLLSANEGERTDIEDTWFFLHLVFETIADYRFLYRDLTELCERSPALHRKMRAILKLSMQTADLLMGGLVDTGGMKAGRRQRDSLMRNIILISSFWIAFDQILEPNHDPQPDRAVWQVMTLVSPYLLGEAKDQFDQLANAYFGP